MKACGVCKEEKSLDEFHNTKRSKDGKQNRCKLCVREYDRTKPKDQQHRSRLDYANTYSQPWSYKERLYEKQLGLCAICFIEIGLYGSHQDHDHLCCPTGQTSRKTCGKCLRGLLCHKCNPMIGLAKEDIQILKQAIMYLEGGDAQ